MKTHRTLFRTLFTHNVFNLLRHGRDLKRAIVGAWNHYSYTLSLSLAVIMPLTSSSAPHNVCKRCASGRCVPMQLINAIPTYWIAYLCSEISFLNKAVRNPGVSSRFAGNLPVSTFNCRYSASVPLQWHKPWHIVTSRCPQLRQDSSTTGQSQ